jgi:hypothetical protein
MKKERTLFLVVLFAACQAVAQQQNKAQLASQIHAASAARTNVVAAVTFAKTKPALHFLGPANPAQYQRKVLQIEGLDTRAWTTVAETWTSRQAFPSGETQRAGLCLLWWGSEPPAQVQ